MCSRRDGSVQVYRNDVEVFDQNKITSSSSNSHIVNAVKISASNILVGENTGAVSVLNVSKKSVSRLEESARGFTAAKPVEAMRVYQQEFYAIGGNERSLKVYDVSTGKQRWKSKNVPNDFLSLRVPIYVSDLRVLKDGHRVLTATAHGQIRLYDMRSDNCRPVMEIKNEYKNNGAARVVMEGWKSICVDSTEQKFVAGDRAGNMAIYELRQGMRRLGKFKDGVAGGSIRDLECHPTRPYVASVGLDRYLRIHDMNTRRLVSKMYLRQRLNAVLFNGDSSVVVESVEDDDDDDEVLSKEKDGEEEDSVWASLDRNTIRMKAEMKKRRQERHNLAKQEEDSQKTEEKMEEEDEEDESVYTFYLKVSGEGLKRSLRGQGELVIESSSKNVRGTYTLEKSTGGTYNGLLEGKRDEYALSLETSAMIGDARRRLSQLDGVINEKELRAKLVGVNSVGKHRTWAFALERKEDEVELDLDDSDDDDSEEDGDDSDDDEEDDSDDEEEEVQLGGADDSDSEEEPKRKRRKR